MSNWKPCPKCSSDNVERMSFTWWGGMLGPRVLSHVKCDDCGTQYNGKSGDSNTTGIVIYSIVIGVVMIVAFFVMLAIAIALVTSR